MITTKTQFRIRYADTDQMGVVYYGNYPMLYETGRTEMFRTLGLPYARLEELGVCLPVVELHSNYHKSARYDDLVTIETTIAQMPDVRIRFDYKIFNEKGELLNTGHTVLIFLDLKRLRPTRLPEVVKDLLEKYFE